MCFIYLGKLSNLFWLRPNIDHWTPSPRPIFVYVFYAFLLGSKYLSIKTKTKKDCLYLSV